MEKTKVSNIEKAFQRKVDRAARLKKKIEELQKEYKELTKEIKAFAREYGIKFVQGKKYVAVVYDYEKVTVDPKKLFEVVDRDVFFQVVSVSNTKLEKILPKNKIAEVAEVEVIPAYGIRFRTATS